MVNQGFKPNIAIPPGETLQEFLDARNMSQVELARRLGLSTKTVNEIIKGKAPLTPETALSLESVFGTSACFWMSLEANYQETKARLDRDKLIKEEYNLIKEIPYARLSKLGVVPATRK